MAPLPTGEDLASQGAFASRALGSTRPLLLSNTDAKILSDALRIGLRGAALAAATEQQRQGARGRHIRDNFVEAEHGSSCSTHGALM
eukprot:9496506-Pyramimonas_sp.AAC.1